MVEQVICNHQVGGSNPSASSRKESQKVEGYPSGQRGRAVNPVAQPSGVRILPPPPFIRAGVTQLVEFQPSKLGVAGSNPVSRSFLFKPT